MGYIGVGGELLCSPTNPEKFVFLGGVRALWDCLMYLLEYGINKAKQTSTLQL